MSPTFPAFFIRSSCALLCLTALAKLYSATGASKILNLADPLFALSNRQMMIGVGVIELEVAIYLLLGKNPLSKFLSVLWLSSNFLLYRLGNYLAGNKTCPCLGTVFDQLGIDADGVNFLLTVTVIYLFAGSVCCLREQMRGSGSTAEMEMAKAATPLGP